MDGVKGRRAEEEIIQRGRAGLQLGGACRERAGKEGLLSVVAFEVGRRPAVSKLQM